MEHKSTDHKSTDHKPFPICRILNTDIVVTNMGDTVRYLSAHLQELRGNYICVSNVHTTVMSYENQEYRKIQNTAAFALPDGKPLSVISKKMGYTKAQRVAGPDLMREMFLSGVDSGIRHFFYGSTKATLNQLEQELKKNYPGIMIAGMYAPPFRALTDDEDRAVIELINNAVPDIVWVGLGAPKQEQWMYRHKKIINSVMIGVGAGFDFHAGSVKRAPKWMQDIGMEWFYRICQDPFRLWKRYGETNIKFLWLIAKQVKSDKGSRI